MGGTRLVLPHCRLHFCVETASVALGSRPAGQSFSNSLFSSPLSSRLTTPLGASCAQKTEAWPLHLESATDVPSSQSLFTWGGTSSPLFTMITIDHAPQLSTLCTRPIPPLFTKQVPGHFGVQSLAWPLLLESATGKPWSHLETSSPSGGTNDSSVVCLKIYPNQTNITLMHLLRLSPGRADWSVTLFMRVIGQLGATPFSVLSIPCRGPGAAPLILWLVAGVSGAPRSANFAHNFFFVYFPESFADSLGCSVRPKDRGMAAPSIGECHRRYTPVPLSQSLFASGGTSPLLFTIITIDHALQLSNLCTMSITPHSQAAPKLDASSWSLQCPKPGMAAPPGECHWEVGQMIHQLRASICLAQTNISYFVCSSMINDSFFHFRYLLMGPHLARSIFDRGAGLSPGRADCPAPSIALRVGRDLITTEYHDLPALCSLMAHSYGLCLLSMCRLSPLQPLSMDTSMSKAQHGRSFVRVPLGSRYHTHHDLSTSFEVDRGLLSLLVSSSSPGGTNDSIRVHQDVSTLRRQQYPVSISQAFEVGADPELPPGYRRRL
ncbi:hypothetical protein CVT26_004844 [Gymnopilus dilepis]|uniref:Uncharacterized protein n=1 Tax=Gymnopilus dilepis TaxID=231916 RepID=A0A409YTW3_9AGAR|nr:hypothetical protein CVT26_004844 [Gymnopilus dilepis]